MPYRFVAFRLGMGHALRNKLKRKGIKTVIPRKSNEKLASDGRSHFIVMLIAVATL